MLLRPLLGVEVIIQDLLDYIFVGFQKEQGNEYLGLLINKKELGLSNDFHLIELVEKIKKLKDKDLIKYFVFNQFSINNTDISNAIKFLNNPYLTEKDKERIQKKIIEELEKMAKDEKREWERWKRLILR